MEGGFFNKKTKKAANQESAQETNHINTTNGVSEEASNNKENGPVPAEK